MAVKIRITRFYGYHLLNTVLPVSQTFEKRINWQPNRNVRQRLHCQFAFIRV